MHLLPRATLHSDSEQFIYNCMLEDDLDLDRGNRKGAKRMRGIADKVVERTPRKHYKRQLIPWQSCWIKVWQKKDAGNKGKGNKS